MSKFKAEVQRQETKKTTSFFSQREKAASAGSWGESALRYSCESALCTQTSPPLAEGLPRAP